MIRSWIGFGLLVVLLLGGIFVTKAMGTVHETVADSLVFAADRALQEEWGQAEAALRRAKSDWDRWEHFRACFADHNPVEDIDSSFALLETYCVTRENAAFAAECKRLARQTAAIGEAHALVWWNIF